MWNGRWLKLAGVLFEMELPQGVIPANAGIHNMKLTLKRLDPLIRMTPVVGGSSSREHSGGRFVVPKNIRASFCHTFVRFASHFYCLFWQGLCTFSLRQDLNLGPKKHGKTLLFASRYY